MNIITVFRNITEVSTPYYIDVGKILSRIELGSSKTNIDLIRRENNKDKRNELKKRLPSILFSGKFPNRKKGSEPSVHSGLLILDIDDLDDIEHKRNVIKQDKYTFSCFTSPSGNGIKVLVKIPPSNTRHLGHFLAIEKYYSELGIVIDPSGKNIGRVCYESYDPNIFINKESDIFIDFIDNISNAKEVFNVPKVVSVTDEDVIIKKIVIWWEKNYAYKKGNRHNSIIALVSAFNRFGVSKSSALRYVNCLPGPKNLERTNEKRVEWAYTKYSHQHGSEAFEDIEKVRQIQSEIQSDNIEGLRAYEELKNLSEGELNKVAHDIQNKTSGRPRRDFWYFDDGKTRIDIEQYLQFVNDSGYWVYYPVKSPDNYHFVHIQNNIICPADTRDIKEVVLNYVREKKQNVVFNILNDRGKYFQPSFLNALPVIEPKILRDGYDYSYIPTPSCVYKITAFDVIKIDYLDLIDGYIWKSQITEKDFNFIESEDYKKTDFYQFFGLVAGRNGNVQALESSIGYLLHTYKDPSRSKALFLFDRNTDMIEGEPEGGTGKSLMIEAIKHIREVAPIPGDRVDFNRSFVFQEINESTQIAWVDELDKNADLSKFFSRITNGLPIEKKRKDAIFIPNERAPKFCFTSNYKPKGTSGSHKRRRIDFAVSNFFSAEHTPIDEFKKPFFVNWSKKDWNLFFTYYVHCLKNYLNSGIIYQNDEEVDNLSFYVELKRDFTDYFIVTGELTKLCKTGEFMPRVHYQNFLKYYEFTPVDFSQKKFYGCLRKALKMLNFAYKIEGKGENKKIYILQDGKKENTAHCVGGQQLEIPGFTESKEPGNGEFFPGHGEKTPF